MVLIVTIAQGGKPVEGLHLARMYCTVSCHLYNSLISFCCGEIKMWKHSKYKKHYKNQWELLPAFQDWLGQDPEDPDRAFCKCCKISLRAHKTDLESHANRKKHQRNFKKILPPKNQLRINNVDVIPIQNETKQAEIMLAVYVATHSGIRAIDHLTSITKKINKSDNFVNNIHLHRTKCSMIIKNVVAKSLKEDIVTDVGDGYYSLIIDESTDVSTIKYLCLCIRYFSVNEGRIITTFIGLIEIRTADAIYLAGEIKKYLQSLGLNLLKMIGIGTDGASNLCGVNHSVYTILHEEIPNLQLVKCIAHSLHLCCKNASECLPSEIDFICKQIYNWFSDSSNRRKDYRELFDLINTNENVKFHNFVKLSGTRWLERANVLKLILEQWIEIRAYFDTLVKTKKDCVPELLIQYLNNDNQLIMMVLHDILNEVNRVNLLFQLDNADLFKIYGDLYTMLLSFLQMIIKPIFLEDLEKMNETNFKKIKSLLDNNLALIPINLLDLGFPFREKAEKCKIGEENLRIVKKTCGDFLWRLCREISQRIPANLHVYESIKYFHPKSCLNKSTPVPFEKLPFSLLNESDHKHELEKQWKKLVLIEWNVGENETAETFWNVVRKYKNAGGQYVFQEIAAFAIKALTLPLSNAVVERVFSSMNMIKTKIRNRINVPLLDALLTVKTQFKVTNTCCESFIPSKNMFQKFNVSMYDHNNKNDSDANDLTEETFEMFDIVNNY